MPDPFRRMAPGVKIKGIPAPAYNRFLDGTRPERNIALPSLVDPNSVQILVRNTTGSALQRFGIVAIEDTIAVYATDANRFKELDGMDGDTPSASAVIAVVQQPLSVNDVGIARLIGLTRCQVNITDESHGYAVPTTSTTELTSATAGPVRILKKASTGTGTKWCAVLLLNLTDTTGGGVTITSKSHNFGTVSGSETETNWFTSVAAGEYLVVGGAPFTHTNNSSVNAGIMSYRFALSHVSGSITSNNLEIQHQYYAQASAVYTQYVSFSFSFTVTATAGFSFVVHSNGTGSTVSNQIDSCVVTTRLIKIG